MQTMIYYSINGWPEKYQKSYFLIIIPTMQWNHVPWRNSFEEPKIHTILCSEMKSIIHEVHFRLENWKKWSYQAHFWPLINNMLTRYSSPYPLLASTKLINQAPNEKSKIRNINFVMAPIPEENAQHSCV